MDGLNKTILIVEDEEILSKNLAEHFFQAGYQALVARNGVEALKLAKENKPAVILLDIILPEMDGLDVLATLKSDMKLQAIPIIVMSNLEQGEEIKEALKLGATDYLVKSQHSMAEIADIIKKYLPQQNK
jgi:two-component system alkaline phosphatase synthesis response regulator PhoP